MGFEGILSVGTFSGSCVRQDKENMNITYSQMIELYLRSQPSLCGIVYLPDKYNLS